METYENDQEVTLKDIILTLKEYWSELWRNWIKIALISLPFLAFYVYKSYNTPPKYFAKTKFFLEGEGSAAGGIGSLLGQFGIKASSGGKNNPFKILEVANSKTLLQDVLFTRVEGDFLANKILETYQLSEKWAENNDQYQGFSFKHDTVDVYNTTEKVALLNLFTLVMNNEKGEALRTINYNEENGVYTIYTQSQSEQITLLLNQITYDNLVYFFEEMVMQKSKETRDLLKNKLDSLTNLVESKMYELGRLGDSSIGLMSLEKNTKKDIIRREITGLSLAQAEAYKSFELADYSYRNQQPQFMMIDKPFTPLIPEVQSLLINIIKGLLFGGLFGATFFAGRKLFRDAMKD